MIAPASPAFDRVGLDDGERALASSIKAGTRPGTGGLLLLRSSARSLGHRPASRPMSAGDLTTRILAAFHGLHLLGGGALAAGDDRAGVAHAAARRRRRPAMKPATGFFHVGCLTYSAASSSALPPISPIITTASVAGRPR